MTLHSDGVRCLGKLISSAMAEDDDDAMPPSVDRFRPFKDIGTDKVDFLCNVPQSVLTKFCLK